MKSIVIFAVLISLSLNSSAQSYIGYIGNDLDVKDSTLKKSVKKVKKGDGVIIFSLNEYKNCYKIHHIKTGKEGFVSRKNILIEKSIPYTASTNDDIKSAIKNSELKDPTIKVYNNTKGVLSIKLNNTIYDFAPKEKKTIKLSSGKYYYRIKAQGYDPYFGVENLEEHKLYDWEFFFGR